MAAVMLQGAHPPFPEKDDDSNFMHSLRMLYDECCVIDFKARPTFASMLPRLEELASLIQVILWKTLRNDAQRKSVSCSNGLITATRILSQN